MQLLINLLFGKPRQGYPLKPTKAKTPRQITEDAFNKWVKEFKVGAFYNHEESHETCEKLKVLKYQQGKLTRELSQVVINPRQRIWQEGQS